MRKLALLPPLLLAAACATPPRPYAPIRDIAYQAIGAEPFWMLAIGDDRIVLRASGRGEAAWPRTLSSMWNGVRTWTSGRDDEITLVVEARPGPCTAANGAVYEDNVRVRANGPALNGCGGRLVRRDRR